MFDPKQCRFWSRYVVLIIRDFAIFNAITKTCSFALYECAIHFFVGTNSAAMNHICVCRWFHLYLDLIESALKLRGQLAKNNRRRCVMTIFRDVLRNGLADVIRGRRTNISSVKWSCISMALDKHRLNKTSFVWPWIMACISSQKTWLIAAALNKTIYTPHGG